MINYYAPVVYQNAMHLSRNTSLIMGGCTSLTYLVGSVIPLWSMDKFGRRWPSWSRRPGSAPAS